MYNVIHIKNPETVLDVEYIYIRVIRHLSKKILSNTTTI